MIAARYDNVRLTAPRLWAAANRAPAPSAAETPTGQRPSLAERIALMKPQIVRLRADIACFQNLLAYYRGSEIHHEVLHDESASSPPTVGTPSPAAPPLSGRASWYAVAAISAADLR